METVEVMIKLPKDMYERTLCTGVVIVGIDAAFIGGAISDGTVLPKGHGDLFDKNEITAFMELECNGHNVKSLDEFTVIIKADKVESEGEE